MKKKFVFIISEFLLCIFVLVSVGSRFLSVDADTTNMLIALIGLSCMLFYALFGNKHLKMFGFALSVFLSVLMLISIIYNGNAKPKNILWIWGYMGVALLLYEFGIRRITAAALFYLFSVYIVYLSLSSTLLLEEILNFGSQNNISVLYIFIMIIYFLTELRFSKSKTMLLLPIFLVLTISIWTANRAAVLVLAAFVLFAFANNIFLSKSSFRQLFPYLIITIILLFLFKYFYSFYSNSLIEKIERYGAESDRTHIWTEYVKGMGQSLGNLVFGVNTSDSHYYYLNYYDGNTHNAFLMLHAKFGLIGLITILFFLYKSVVKAIKLKHYRLISLLFVVALRSLFDWTAFPGLLDVIFYFFIIYYIDSKMLCLKVYDHSFESR